MARTAERGELIADAVTLRDRGDPCAVAAAYAFVGAGLIRRLPLMRTALVAITAIYCARPGGAVAIALDAFRLARAFNIWSSLIVLGYGFALPGRDVAGLAITFARKVSTDALDPRPDGGARRARIEGRLLRQPWHRHSDAGREQYPGGHDGHAAVRERHARDRAVPLSRRGRSRPDQRRQADHQRI